MMLSFKVRDDAPVLIGLALTIAVMIGGLLLAWELQQESMPARAIIARQAALADLIGQLDSAESRVLTGAPRNSANEHASVARALNAVAETGGGQGRPVTARLRQLADIRLDALDDAVDPRSDMGRDAMRRIRAIVAAEQQASRTHLNRSSDAIRQQRWLIATTLAIGTILLLLTCGWWARNARARLAEMDAARRDAEAALSALKTEVAAREAAEDELRHVQRIETIGRLTGGIAHDFNNMLAIVIGGLDLATRRFAKAPEQGPEQALAAIARARAGAERAAALTARLLAFARPQPLAPRAVDANRLILDMSDMLRRTLGDDIRIEIRAAEGLWQCHADAGELENAIVNLAINARDAMLDGGGLTITTANESLAADDATDRDMSAEGARPGDHVSIEIADTGHGMPPDVIARAFEPFFTTKPVGKGTGLGLTQVFGFATRSGGHVSIASEPDQGTTVTLFLPRFAGDAPVAATATVDEATPAGRADELILVVEDEERVRDLAVAALSELGYSVVAAASAAEALRIVADRPQIALLFTDIMMPGMDGRALAEAIGRNHPGIPVLLTTGYVREAIAGDADMLAKPWSIARLAQAVRGAIDRPGHVAPAKDEQSDEGLGPE